MQGYLRINLSADQKASIDNSALPVIYRTTIANSKAESVFTEDVPWDVQIDQKGAFVKTITFDLPTETYTPTVQLFDKNGKAYGASITGSFTVAETSVNLPGTLEFVAV